MDTLIVYGEPICFNPEMYPQQAHGGMGHNPHLYYRYQIGINNIAVEVISEAEYMTDRQRIADLESKLANTQEAISRALTTIVMADAKKSVTAELVKETYQWLYEKGQHTDFESEAEEKVRGKVGGLYTQLTDERRISTTQAELIARIWQVVNPDSDMDGDLVAELKEQLNEQSDAEQTPTVPTLCAAHGHRTSECAECAIDAVGAK